MLTNTAGKSTFAVAAFCAAMVATAPLTNAQPAEGNSGPAQEAEAVPDEATTQKSVKLVANGYGYFSGSVRFAPAGKNHGGFVFEGTSHDTEDDDAEVYLEVAVEGYAPNRFYNKVDKDQKWRKEVYDYQAVRTRTAEKRICPNRTFASCSDWQHFKR